MRGGTNNFEMMSSTCVQNVGGGIPHNLGGGGYESAHILEARSPAPAWHHMNTSTSNLNATLTVVSFYPTPSLKKVTLATIGPSMNMS